MFTLSSPAFSDGGPVPRAHTCDGANLSPPLAWGGAPASTKSFALIMDDPDAGAEPFVHWVLYNLAGDVTGLPSGVPTDPETTRPVRAHQGTNSFHRIGYGGPCPPKGPGHRYSVTLYALDTMLPLPAGATKFVLLDAIKTHIVGESHVTGRYTRA